MKKAESESISGLHSKLPKEKPGLLLKLGWTAIIICFAISIMDLTGWIAGISWLTSMGSGWPPMKPNVAICFVFVSAALAVLLSGRSALIKTAFPAFTGVFLLLLSSITVIISISDRTAPHEIFFRSFALLSLFFSPDERMSVLTALVFFITGIVLILLSSGKQNAANAAHIIILPVAVAVYIIPLGYILDIYRENNFLSNPVALNTGLASWAMCIAVFAVERKSWLMKVLTGKNVGGVMARKLLPWILILPLAIDWLIVRADEAKTFNIETGQLLADIAYTFCFIILVWFTAKSINKADQKRRIIAEALKKSHEELEEKVRKRTSELSDLNKALDNEIRGRIKTEELLKSERTKINNILEIIPAYIILLTPDHHVLYSNRNFRERFGISNGKRCFEFLFNRTEPCEVCETYKTFREGKPLKWEWTGPDKRIYSVYDFPYTDDDNSPLVMEMGIDITELKKAEANMVALNAELEERVRKRTSELSSANERLSILSRTSGQLLASDKPWKIISSLCTDVMKILDCQVFFNYLITEKSDRLHLNCYSGITDQEAGKIEWLEYDDSVNGCVRGDGTGIIAENIPGTNDTMPGFVKSFGIRAYACHPLFSDNKVTGTLAFGTSTRNSFTSDDLSLMKTVADQVAVAITRVKNENLLRKSEERYRKLMECSPSACLVTRNDSIELLNSAAQKLLGISSQEEAVGTSPMNYFHPDYHHIIRERMARIVKGENIPMIEERIIRADGSLRDIEVISVGIDDADGPAFQVIMNDITERKQSEEELIDTKNYLENLINYANAPIIVWDQKNRIRVFNRAFERLTGYKASEVEGKKLNILFPENSMKQSLRMIRNALTRNMETIEIPILTKENDIRTVLWNSARVFDNKSKSISTIAQGYDITEKIKAEEDLKDSRERLEIALENGKTGIWEWDIGRDYFWIDGRMEKILGVRHSYFQNNFASFEKCIHEEDQAHFRNAVDSAIKKDMPLDTLFRISHKKGEINYISTKALVKKENGNPVKMSGVCFDISEMKKGAESALFQLNEDLLRSNKELEQFAYVASHDLQEPLRMVSGFTQLLLRRYEGKLDQDAQDFIGYAVDGAARMQVLINDLLDYSRIGIKGRAFSRVDMQSVLGKAIYNLKLKIEEKNALVTNDDLPEINADEGQMVQLLQNLIGNAIKFCNSSPIIHISAAEKEDHFLFSVRDNGIGIESQYFSRIFQIFQRLHPRDVYGGTGIGLAICKRITERHCGKIWVESVPGEGSEFFFTIKKM